MIMPLIFMPAINNYMLQNDSTECFYKSKYKGYTA